jgi:glucokinase
MLKEIIGIDVGGTKISGGLVCHKKIVKQKTVIVKEGGRFLLEQILDIAQGLKTPRTKAVGIGLPGQIDPQKGVLHFCHHYPDAKLHLPVAPYLKTKLKLPVFIDHDLNCFVAAEATMGQGKKYPVVAGLTIGTGLGFGLAVNREIFRGGHNLVEFGHTVIQPNGLKCACGGFGHLESYVSGKAMVYLYKKKTGRSINTFKIVADAKSGKKAALSVLKEISDYLAIGLANIIYSYNPDIVVIGGGLSTVDLLIKPACQKVKKLLRYPDQRKTKIVKSKTPYQSNILGAALITNRHKYE